MKSVASVTFSGSSSTFSSQLLYREHRERRPRSLRPLAAHREPPEGQAPPLLRSIRKLPLLLLRMSTFAGWIAHTPGQCNVSRAIGGPCSYTTVTEIRSHAHHAKGGLFGHTHAHALLFARGKRKLSLDKEGMNELG